LLDASLPDGSRIQLTYGSEITRRGSTFTIRRFRVDPLTISDLIALKTVSAEMAAYFWFAIENRASVLVAGGVAAGKTTLLNCLSMFIKPECKIVSVEDTAELNLPHENWIAGTTRSGFTTTEALKPVEISICLISFVWHYGNDHGSLLLVRFVAKKFN
jgi:flagellar protein FlaI